MKRNSLQFRLTLWYSVSLIVTLIVVFASFYLVTKRVLLSQTDATLAAHGNQILISLSLQDTDMHQAMARQTYLGQLEEAPGMLIAILDESGNVVSSSQKITQHEGDMKGLFASAQSQEKQFFVNQTVATVPMRFWVYPLRMSGKISMVVAMGHPTEVIQKSLNQLLILLGIVFLLLLIPTVMGGYLYAKAALHPIDLISETLKRISHEHLNERVLIPDTGDQLAELGKTFNGLLDRLSGAFQRERQFIADVAHELKTPLAILQATTEVTLAKKRTNEEYRQALIDTQTDTKQIATTVEHILDLAWSEADQTGDMDRHVNLSELIGELREITTRLASVKNIIVTGSIEKEIFIAGKEEKLSRALLNVVENAVKYTPAHGTISLDLHKKHAHATISVKDSGIGIASKDIPHIFDRFYRGAKTRKAGSSGLGLAIAKATIVAHRGSIEMKSIPGKGTMFTMTLPLVQVEVCSL